MITQVQERGLYPLQKSLYHLMPKLLVFASRTTWMIYRFRSELKNVPVQICTIRVE